MNARKIDFDSVVARTDSQVLKVAYGQWREKVRSNIANFIEAVIRDEKGDRVVLASIHRIWHVHFEYCWRAGLYPFVEAPYAHGKTVNLIMSRAAYEVGHDPSIRIKIVTNIDGKARERVLGCQQIMFSAPYRRLFPNVRPVEQHQVSRQRRIGKVTQHQLYVARPGFSIDPTIEGAAVLGAGAGGRADLILFDDVVDLKNAVIMPAQRKAVSSSIENTWMSRLEPNARAGGVGTPYHEADWYHSIRNDPRWCVLRCPISADRTQIDLEVYNPPPGYPIPVLDSAPSLPKWTRVNSSNILEFRYDPLGRTLDVRFHRGTAYRYPGVPQRVVDGFLASRSKGRYFDANVRRVYTGSPLEDDGT